MFPAKIAFIATVAWLLVKNFFNLASKESYKLLPSAMISKVLKTATIYL
jgi:hypothetical protein